MKNGFLLILLFLLPILNTFGGGDPSVMSSGDWYKITVDRDGIYRITYAELRNLGITDPANVRIYGSGGAMLPEVAGKNFGEDLKEIPIWVYTGSDGIFNDGDYIVFYGQGPAIWRYNKKKQVFEHSIHLWDNQSCYFITSRAGGKRITTEAAPQTTPGQTVTTFDEHQYHELEQMSLLKSGRYWYGEDFRSETTFRIPFTVPDIDAGVQARMNISFMAQTPATAYLEVKCGDQQVANQPLPVNPSYQTATEVSFNTSPFNSTSGNISVDLILNKNGNANAGGWLDYIRLFARRKLNMSSSQLFFRDTQSAGEGRTARFQITNCSANTQVWDITDMHRIQRMDASLTGNTLAFVVATDTLREFVAFDMSLGLLKPSFPENNSQLSNQDLHSVDNTDMVILTHPDFMDAAQSLAALHRDKDGMAVEVFTTGQVYNEFSSGMQDPAAIRNFMKLLYEKPGSRLKYLLLMGDGSYNNKSNRATDEKAVAQTNFIVTYQSVDSWHSTNSYVSDDYFGVLEDNKRVKVGKLAIGVGRLPVQSAEQAKSAVDKIRRYIDTKAEGDWPNLIGLLADDEDGNLHTVQSENLAGYIQTEHPQYAVDKLYFDAFPQATTADGHRYPEVEQRLSDLMNKGCLMVNYIGHGNESGLSAERVVNTTSISQWKNKLYPLFVAATCEFGRYDNDAKITAGEDLLLSPSGGGIAVLTSTRLVYSSLNFEFNRNFFIELLSRPEEKDEHRLGDVLRRAKNASDTSVNKLCFTLLGDPALKPVIPSGSVQTLSINGKSITEPLDTLKANSHVTIKGNITGAGGSVLTGFNGVLYLSLFDKPQESKTLDNDGVAYPLTFSTQTSILYKGKTTVKDGGFEMSFVMPRDIAYQYGFGKISYYAYSKDGAAAGSFAKITVGGSVPGVDDTKGPKIRLFMNDTLFRNGGITDQNPKLIAYLEDESGINTSDGGIGHQITAMLNNDQVYYLNPYYEAALNSHNKGVVNYRFTNLPVGDYKLLFTAWDLENNSSQDSLHFRVTQSMILQMTNLYNYPNPFIDGTNIYFEFNMPDTEIEAELQVYDMSGRLLRSMKQSLFSAGYTSGQFRWDGDDGHGNRMRAGIYPYRVILRTSKGQMVWQSSKMMIGN